MSILSELEDLKASNRYLERKILELTERLRELDSDFDAVERRKDKITLWENEKDKRVTRKRP